MNTPKKAPPNVHEVAQLLATHGIALQRPHWLGESNVIPTEYTDLTDVALRRVREPVEGLFIAESSKIIRRAADAGYTFRSFLMNPRWLADLSDVLAGSQAPIYVGNNEQLEALTGFHVHRGALAAVERPTLPEVKDTVDGASRIVIVEDVVDHTNLGAIFRSVAGFNIDAVLVTPRCADPLYRRAVRVSMGTVFQVPWTRISDWPGSLHSLKELGFHITALALRTDSVRLQDFAATPPDRVAIVMGTEGNGLHPATINAADSTVTIPMSHGVDSLNVAAATAVACFALQKDQL